MTRLRVVAVDWSGRAGPEQRQALWLAEAVDGQLVRLEGGRTRDELVEVLNAEAGGDAASTGWRTLRRTVVASARRA